MAFAGLGLAAATGGEAFGVHLSPALFPDMRTPCTQGVPLHHQLMRDPTVQFSRNRPHNGSMRHLIPNSTQGDPVSRRADHPSRSPPHIWPTRLFQPLATQLMGSNWVTSYMNGGNRPSRYQPTPEHWLELQRRLGQWGGGQTWRRLDHLGAIAKTDQAG